MRHEVDRFQVHKQQEFRKMAKVSFIGLGVMGYPMAG